MLKIYTSYFYQVRFMKPYHIPCSTALWDPKWFHGFQGSEHIFRDKNGVLNGLRAEMFAPGPWCSDLCRGPEMCNQKPDSCGFLRAYRSQFADLDIAEVMSLFEGLAGKMKEYLGLDREPEFILLFHEAPNNPCSERVVVQEWFKANGVLVEEWNKSFV